MKEHKIIKIDQELYILSDELISEGSWFTDGRSVYYCEILLDGYIGFKKIIASTDTLMISEESSDHVPLISQEFKKSYLENPVATIGAEHLKDILKVDTEDSNTPTNNQEILSLISKVDDTLCRWEDYFKGEEGIDVTNARVDLVKIVKLVQEIPHFTRGYVEWMDEELKIYGKDLDE